MRDRATQAIILIGVIVGLGYLVVQNADDWSDWVVFGVIVLTAYGAAIAIYPRMYANRKRTISRDSTPPPRRSSGP